MYSKDNINICVFDIENSYMELNIRTFSLYDNNVISPKNIVQESWIHCVGYKWLGSRETKVVSTHDDVKRFNKDHTDDYHVVRTMHEVLSRAHIIIGHNMARFDWPKLNDKFIYYKLPKIDKPIIIDTLREAKRICKRPSYKLEALCQYFAEREDDKKMLNKLKKMYNTPGLWDKTFEGDLGATKKMAKYCKQDIFLTEYLYDRLKPYMENHPNINRVLGKQKRAKDVEACGTCGSKDIKRWGTYPTKTGLVKRFYCAKCGSTTKGGKVK